MSQAERLRALHHGDTPLVLPNAWDALSAQIIADAGYPAVATSSGAAARVLGYEDGQLTPPDEMFAVVARMVSVVDVPVTADMEAGYGLSPREFTERLLETGAAGCNLEDSTGSGLTSPEQHADYLAGVREVAGADLVVNARIDSFLHGGTVADAIARGRAYRRVGADCVYPIFAPVESIAELKEGVGGPLNAHAAPDGPTAAELIAAGATRITYGTSLHRHLMDSFRKLLPELS